MSEIHHPTMELDQSTFTCPTCNCEIAAQNQLTHEVACARMHRNGGQRAPVAQPIIRQSSSSAIPDQSEGMQQRVQPMPKREDRRIVENKLVACPNCEKSVREQDINNHMDNECLKNELIPCEFCDESISMSDYSEHVESCPRRSQNHQQNNRDRSPGRNRPNADRQIQEESDNSPQVANNQRDISPERGSAQEAQPQAPGGIRGFFSNLAQSAANQLRSYNESLQRQVQERQRELEEQQRREQAERTRQQEFLDHMFGQPQAPRNPFSNQNAGMPSRGGSGSRVVRTIERGPMGTVIVRTRVVPADEQMPGHPMERGGMGGVEGMNPMELLFGLMNGRMGGMHDLGNGEMGNQDPEESGLDKETLENLATVKYSREMSRNLDEESKNCPICLDKFEAGQDVKFLWCMHRFHKNCVDQWLDQHTNCPICKKDFSEAEQADYSS